MNFLEKLQKNDKSENGELLLVNINDQDLQIEKIRGELFKNLDNIALAIPDNNYILNHQGFTDTEDIYGLIQTLENIPQLNKSYLQAIKAIVEYNSRNRLLTEHKIDNGTKSIISKQIFSFEGNNYDYQTYIYKCASFLYNKYNFSFDVVGEFDGYERNNWHKIKTPYGTFTMGNRSMKKAPVGSKPGDIINIKNEGFMIGEKMRNRHSGKECVIINAGHEHNSFNKGTARIIVIYKDGSIEKVVPRGLEKFKTAKKKEIE